MYASVLSLWRVLHGIRVKERKSVERDGKMKGEREIGIGMFANGCAASIICVDLIIRQFPGRKHFRIEDSNEFLSGGLSLSFGVMVCMAVMIFV